MNAPHPQDTPTVWTVSVAEALVATPPGDDLLRLDTLLTQWFQKAYSRSRLQRLIKDGAVTVNGQPVTKTGTALRPTDVVTITFPADRPLTLPPSSLTVPVLFEDEHLLVVNKPRGMLTHPVGHQLEDTLVNVLLTMCAGRLSSINGAIRPGIVHRLDRDTAGLLVVAKTDVAHQGLSQQIQAKTAGREYCCIAQGDPRTRHGEGGVITAAIGRAPHPLYPGKRCVDASGKPAETHWQFVTHYQGEHYPGHYSLLHCQLKTGRTHQIRVHLAHLGHPLFGDVLYGTGVHQQFPARLQSRGQALQAFRLVFTHPVEGTRLRFEIEPDGYMADLMGFLAPSMDAENRASLP